MNRFLLLSQKVNNLSPLRADGSTSPPRWLYFLMALLSIPTIVFTFIGGTGLWASIAFLFGLFRYWGDWGIFIGVIVLKTFESSCKGALNEYIKKHGDESVVLSIITLLLQYSLIWLAIKSFF